MSVNAEQKKMVHVSARNGTVLMCLIVVSVFSLLGWWLLYYQQTRRIYYSREFRGQCVGTIALTLQNYNETYGHLPEPVLKDPKGKPLASWRVAILGFSPDGRLPGLDATRPWNDPVNKKVTSKRLVNYCIMYKKPLAKKNHTSVVAVVGPGTAFDGKKRNLSDLPHDTIILIEMGDSGIPWAAPGDLPVAQLKKLSKQGADGKGFHVAFADTKVWYLRKNVPKDVLKKFCLVKEAAKYDRKKLLAPYAIAR